MFCYQPAACRGNLRSFRRNAFHFQIEQGIVGCEKIEKLLKGRNSLGGEFVSCFFLAPAKPTPDIHLLQLRRRHIGNPLLDRCGSLQRFVVNNYRHAVASKAHVKLHSVGTSFNCKCKRGERVFRSNCRCAAVANDQRLICQLVGYRSGNLRGWTIDHSLEFDVKSAIVALDSTTDRDVSTIVC
jgi:hypothetical protein